MALLHQPSRQRQRQPQFASLGLLPLALVQAHADLVQLRLTHDPRQPKQKPIMVSARIVQPLAVSDEHVKDRAQLQQLVPVVVVAGQARGVQAQHQAGLAQTDLGDQALEAVPLDAGRSRLAKVVIDHRDAFPRPTQRRGPVDQAILQLRALLVLADLNGCGLADIDIGQLGAVRGADARGRVINTAQHDVPPRGHVAAGGQSLAPIAAVTGLEASAMASVAACGAQRGERAARDCGNEMAWTISVLEAVTTLRMYRASGSSLRAETRGTGGSVASGRSRSVAARRIRRRRPSGKATAMNRGPRAQASDRTARRWPDKGWRGSVTVTAGIRHSTAVAI